ncbi:MAG: hypothetical protein ACWIPJ_09410 [Polaribacter sp.]
MKLTQTQIQKLYKFTRKHYVEHFDVQTELVDHLANDIEEIWKENPILSFEEARDKSFKKFGIFGFMEVIEAKQKQLEKRYYKILWRYVKEWFTVLKISVTAVIFMVLFLLTSSKLSKFFFVGIVLILSAVDIILVHQLTRKSKKRLQQKNKKWLLESIIFRTGSSSSGVLFCVFFQISLHVRTGIPMYAKLLLSGFITFAIIYSYVTLVIIPKKAEELLEETYPEYKLSRTL